MPNEAIKELREQAVALELRAKAIEAEEGVQRAAALPPQVLAPEAAPPVAPVQAAPVITAAAPAQAPAIGSATTEGLPPGVADAAAETAQRGGPGRGLTKEELDSMSRDEVLARMDEVDEALRRGV
jgi:hypothetical protein